MAKKKVSKLRKAISVQLSKPMEIRLGYVLPGLFVFGALVNLALSTPNWHLRGFAQVALHASGKADYSPDSTELIFAPVNPDIIEDVQSNGSDSLIEDAESSQPSRPTPIPATPPATIPTPTTSITNLPQPTHVPTNPGLPLPTDILPNLPLPTDMPELPNLPSIPELPDLPALPEPDIDLPNPPASLDSFLNPLLP